MDQSSLNPPGLGSGEGVSLLDSAGEAGVSSPAPGPASRLPPEPTMNGTGAPVSTSSEPEQDPLDLVIERALDHLLALQKEDGHWCAELEGDSILQSDYVMLLWILGMGADPRVEMACRTLRATQLETGGWAIYPGGPPDASASVKAYFVLKLQGDDPAAPHMQRAAAAIRSVGGVANANSFTKIYLAIFQQVPWKSVPAVPPELILTPRWFLLNVAEMSAWSRAIVVPLAMIWALKPRCAVPVRIDELITGARADRPGTSLRERFWFAFFRGVDRGVKLAESVGAFGLTRKRALDRCEQWTLERLPKSAGLAAIVPAIANAAVALRERGYSTDDGPLADQLEELRKLELVSDAPEGPRLRLQPCCSPVWDTALSTAACVDAGVPVDSEVIRRSWRWLLDREVRDAGDWQATSKQDKPSGWYFEYANEFYPDCDDTAEVLTVLQLCRGLRTDASNALTSDEHVLIDAAIERGCAWLTGMQNADGGWGAFDRGCDRELLTFVPFADHNAMIDPSTADVTARAVEALYEKFGEGSESVQRGAQFLEAIQEEDGSWYGRWGCNYIYGTWLAVSALSKVGRADQTAVKNGVAWLLSVQLDNGGWGETLETYDHPSTKGAGPATAAQTAWAMMALLAHQRAAGSEAEEAVAAAISRGATFLQRLQNEDGSWHDEQWTGTGFPQVFYLRYHLYDRYFPLQALAQFREFQARDAHLHATANRTTSREFTRLPTISPAHVNGHSVAEPLQDA